MLRYAIALSFTIFMTACAVDMSTDEQDLGPQNGPDGAGEPHDAKVVHVKGHAHTSGGSADLIYHGGNVAHTTSTKPMVIQPIFWGASWSSSSFVQDKITGLNTFYSGLATSSYAASNSEYTDSAGNVSTGNISVLAAKTDFSAAAKNGARTSTILAEVCKEITNPVKDGYYPVYIDNPRGHSGYCAWHSTGSCNGVRVQFAFFYNLDGDPGCDPGNNTTHSDGLEALANVTGHEWSEMVTDPQLDAWYDGSGAENADKCAWTWGDNVTINSQSWKVQGNYSNKAAATHSGYDGGGCIE